MILRQDQSVVKSNVLLRLADRAARNTVHRQAKELQRVVVDIAIPVALAGVAAEELSGCSGWRGGSAPKSNKVMNGLCNNRANHCNYSGGACKYDARRRG